MQPPPNYDPSQRYPYYGQGQQSESASASVPISMPNAWQPSAPATSYAQAVYPPAPPQGFFVPTAPSEHHAAPFIPSSFPQPTQSQQYPMSNSYDPTQFAPNLFSMPQVNSTVNSRSIGSIIAKHDFTRSQQSGVAPGDQQAFFMPNLTPLHLMQAGKQLPAGTNKTRSTKPLTL